MDAANADRAAMLVKALGKIKAVASDLKSPAREGCQRVIEIGAPEAEGGFGSTCDSFFYLPPDFGETLLPVIETAIRRELKRLGVDL